MNLLKRLAVRNCLDRSRRDLMGSILKENNRVPLSEDLPQSSRLGKRGRFSLRMRQSLRLIADNMRRLRLRALWRRSDAGLKNLES